jgi:plasmid stabilization system protein ParE
MRIVYAPRALRDIDEILAYIHERSPRGARNVSLAIEHTIRVCALNPDAAAKTDEPNLFRRSRSKYRYTIFVEPSLITRGSKLCA